MNKFIYILVFFLFCSLSCKKQSETPKACCKKSAETTNLLKITDESIFNIDNTWTTQNNDTLKLSHWDGKITVAAMVFTHCPSACPRIVADMQRIEAALSKDELKQVTFLLISMDPERDNPARLKEFAAEHQLNNNWTLITANQDATMVIANVLGVRIKKLSGGGFDHSNIIHIIDTNGNIKYQQNGLAVEPIETIKIVKSLTNK